MGKAFQCDFCKEFYPGQPHNITEFGNEICDSCVKIAQVFSDTDPLELMVSVSNEE